MSTQTLDTASEVSAFSRKSFPSIQMVDVVGFGRVHVEELLNNEFAQCSVRGSYHLREDMTKTHSDVYICRGERDLNWFRCQDTVEWFHISEQNTVYDNYGTSRVVCSRVADQEYRQCTHYGTRFPREDGVYTRSGNWISYAARTNGPFFTCENCGEVCSEGEQGSGDWCTDCDDSSDDDEGDSSVIREYECRRYPKAKGKGPLFYGVELEVEVKSGVSVNDSARHTLQTLGEDFVILKSDGSLNRGYEIVSCPADFETHCKAWDSFIDNQANRRGLLSHDTDTCGMHVHVTREALSALQLGKMLVFVNQPANADFVTFIAGRASAHYCQRKAKKLIDGRSRDMDRYTAINTGGQNTIEFRIFKGTLNPNRFRSNLQFVDALVRFCAPFERGATESNSTAEFCKFVTRERKRYPQLFQRLVEAGHCKAPKVKPATV